MLLDVSRALMYPGQSYPFEGALDLPAMDVLDDTVSFEGVQIKGTFRGAGESVSVHGTITATVNAHCALCMGAVAEAIKAPVDEVFSRTPDPENPDLYPLDGHSIALDALVKDALLLEMPMRFLCGGDCMGLCPVCGENLNLRLCACHEGAGRKLNPFSALREMLSEDEEV